MLGPGARGGGVADLQRRLTQLGFPVGPIDGVFGAQTHKALMDFQRASGVGIDGIDGPQTEAALTNYKAPAGGPVGPPPQPGNRLTIDQDPTYLMFMQGQGVRESEVRAWANMKQSAIMSSLQDSIPPITLRGEQEREKIAADFSDRGAWNSGGRVQDMNRSQAMQDADISKVQQDAQNQQDDVTYQMEKNLADLRLEGSEAATAAASRVSQQGAAQGQDVSATPSPTNAPVNLT